MPAWYDDLVAAAESGEPRYLVCDDCDESMLPPRRRCPTCGSTSLTARRLPTKGRVVSYSEIHVTIPALHGSTPYTVVLAEFKEGVRLTGQLTGDDAIDLGDTVTIGSASRDDGRPMLTFSPHSSDG